MIKWQNQMPRDQCKRKSTLTKINLCTPLNADPRFAVLFFTYRLVSATSSLISFLIRSISSKRQGSIGGAKAYAVEHSVNLASPSGHIGCAYDGVPATVANITSEPVVLGTH